MLKHEVKESETIIQKTDHWSGDIAGYSVIFEHDENHGAKLSIYPNDRERGTRLGIIECRPDNVASLDKFAEDAPNLFAMIAAELREIGKDDLRDKWEIQREEVEAAFRRARV